MNGETFFMKPQRAHTIRWGLLAACLAIPLGLGGLSAFFIRDSMPEYASLSLPPLSPPGVVFPIVWTVLYVLMGISTYQIAESARPQRIPALWVYGVQLLVNVVWPLLFFRLHAHLLSFFWLILLWDLTAVMIFLFWKVQRSAAVLQIPYFLWLTFAGYLNLGVYLMNR